MPTKGRFDWGPGGPPPKQAPIYSKDVIPGGSPTPDLAYRGAGTISVPGTRGENATSSDYVNDPNQFSPNQRFTTGNGITREIVTQDSAGRVTSRRFEGTPHPDSLVDYTNQLVPTSQNIRNNTLQDILQELNRPGESARLGQLMAGVSDKRAMGSENAYATAAARGLGSSGMLERVLRSNNLGYVKDVANAQNTARNEEQDRKLGLVDQISNLVNTDIDFWHSLSAGRNAALRKPIYNLGQGSNLGGFGRATAGAGGGATFPSTISYDGVTSRPPINSGSPYGFNDGSAGSPNYFGGGNIVPSGNGTYEDEFGTRFGY